MRPRYFGELPLHSKGKTPQEPLGVGSDGGETHILTKQSFDSTAMTLFSSLGCNPILPAKSSSLRLRKPEIIYQGDEIASRKRDEERVTGGECTRKKARYFGK